MKPAAVIALLLLTALTLRADDPALRLELERTYSTWRTAMITRDMTAYQQATAAHRQMTTRNLIVSQKQHYPNALFALPIRPAEISTLRFLQTKAVGNTAHAAYFGKVDLGLVDAAEVPDNILVLKFVKEATGWKFDTSRLLNLESSPDLRASLKNGARSSVLDEPSLTPDGVVPPTAKACPNPDHIGVLQVASIGYTTKATVNGFDVATVRDNAEEHLIIGGLTAGENPLVIEAKEQPIPEGEVRQLHVSALVLTGNEKKPYVQVFTWKPDGVSLAGPVKATIFVNRITLRD